MRDLVADEVEGEGLRLSVANDGNLDVRAFGSFEVLGDYVGGHAFCRFAIDGGNDVAGANARAEGRSAFVWCDDVDLIVLLLDDHADTVVVAALIFAHFGVGFGIVEVGVGVEDAEHSGDGAVVDCCIGPIAGNGLGVVLFDDGVYVSEGFEAVANLALVL